MNSKFDSHFRLLTICIPILIFSACGHRAGWDMRSSGDNRPFDTRSETGYASWYGPDFNGKKTSSGEIYDMYAMTAAHRNAPFGTRVHVTNLDNGKETIVTVNDRGPFVRGRIIDLSKKAAEEIGMMGAGTAKVQLDFLDRKPITIGTVYIQVGSFESQDNAQLFFSNFQRTVPNITARIYNEKDLYRVRTGPYATDEAAQTDLTSLKKLNFEGFILHTE